MTGLNWLQSELERLPAFVRECISDQRMLGYARQLLGLQDLIERATAELQRIAADRRRRHNSNLYHSQERYWNQVSAAKLEELRQVRWQAMDHSVRLKEGKA